MIHGSNFIYLCVTHMISLGEYYIHYKGGEPKTQIGHHCLRLRVCCLEELKVRTRIVTGFGSSYIKIHRYLLQVASGPKRGSNMHVTLWNWYMTQDNSSVELPNIGGSRRVVSESRCEYTTRGCYAVALQGQGLSRYQRLLLCIVSILPDLGICWLQSWYSSPCRR